MHFGGPPQFANVAGCCFQGRLSGQCLMCFFCFGIRGRSYSKFLACSIEGLSGTFVGILWCQRLRPEFCRMFQTCRARCIASRFFEKGSQGFVNVVQFCNKYTYTHVYMSICEYT